MCIRDSEATYKELPLLQGWNKVSIKIGERDKNEFSGNLDVYKRQGKYSTTNIRKLRATFGTYLLLELEFLIASDLSLIHI